jgi:hypothetical protein
MMLASNCTIPSSTPFIRETRTHLLMFREHRKFRDWARTQLKSKANTTGRLSRITRLTFLLKFRRNRTRVTVMIPFSQAEKL